jgi:hypothetical protein
MTIKKLRHPEDEHGEIMYKSFKIFYYIISIKIWYSARAELVYENAVIKTLELEHNYPAYSQARGAVVNLAKQWIDSYFEIEALW